MFALNQIVHAYSGKTVLKLDAWTAAQGEHWLLLGLSGSGKTTLLHILAGLLMPTSGEVIVANQNLRELSGSQQDKFRARNIGVMFQKHHLLDSLSVFDNLRLAQYLAGVPQNRKRIHCLLSELRLSKQQHAYPHNLSQGQSQRVALARAVINQPQVILADEPTSSLDDVHCERVLDLLEEQAHACNATLLIATHDARIKRRLPSQLTLEPVA